MKQSDKLPLKFRLLLSAIFLGVIAFVAFTLPGSVSPRTASQAKGIVAAGICAILLIALWVPPFGRLLLRMVGR